jgi:catechol 2,3-dioxygenase
MYKTRLAHVRLSVRDLEMSVGFYTRFLHLELTERSGSDYAFLSSNDAHHVLALFAIPREHGPADQETDRVHHIAFEVPGRKSFTRAFSALSEAGIQTTTLNNGISWAIYFEDPDSNQLEIFCDTQHEADGQPLWQGTRRPLGAEQILAALSRPEPSAGTINQFGNKLS